MWCICLSLFYQQNLVYEVKGSFLHRFGKQAIYWLALVCTYVAAICFDIGIITLRVAFFPKDADTFAELEKDPLIKTRFEEEAASELQQSWNRGKGISDDQIQALLNQPRILEDGNASSKTWGITTKVRTSDDDVDEDGAEVGGVSGLDVPERRESATHTGFDEELAERFGAVIRKPFRRTQTSEST